MDFKDKNIEKAVNLLAESRKVGRKEAVEDVLKLVREYLTEEEFEGLKKEVEKLKEAK